MTMSKKKLTEKQKRFALEYLVDFNATQAAIRAGYSKRTAHAVGHENLTKSDIQKLVKELADKATEKVEVEVNNILRELLVMGFFDPADFTKVGSVADIAKLPEHVRRAIAGWSWDKQGNFILKFHDKKSVLELLGKYKSMWTEKHDHNHGGDVTFTMVYQGPTDT